MPDVKPVRTYSSPRREQAAEATREAVLDAARSCFLEGGYAATTVAEIAARAEVSKPTVFATGTKAQLLKLVRDRAMAGDDAPDPVADRAPFKALLAEPDPHRTVRLFARHVVQLVARYADVDEVLRQAAGADPELRELWITSERQRLVGAGIVVDNLIAKGPLRRGCDRDQAVEVLWVLMAPDAWRRLRSQGWSPERYERWLADLIGHQLLPPTEAEGAG